MSVISAVLVSLGICIVSVILESLFAGKNVKEFFVKLRTPKYAPPFWVWIVIGVLYYVICFFISYRILRHDGDDFWKTAALVFLLTMMGVNAFWNYVFLRAQNLFLSVMAFIPYPMLAVGLFVCLLQFEPTAAWVFLPYVVYLNYAAFICYRYWKLNEHLS